MSSLSCEIMWAGEEHCNSLDGRWFSCEEISAEKNFLVLGEIIQ
jgi:hypothetical protein